MTQNKVNKILDEENRKHQDVCCKELEKKHRKRMMEFGKIKYTEKQIPKINVSKRQYLQEMLRKLQK